MICSHCNREIPDGSIFCGYCGNKIDAVNPSDNVTAASVFGVPEPVSDSEYAVSDMIGQTSVAAEQISEAAEQDYNAAEQISEAAEQGYNAEEQISEAAEQDYNAAEQVYEAAEQGYNAAEQISETAQSSGYVPPYNGEAQQVSQNAAWFANAANQIPGGTVPGYAAADQSQQNVYQQPGTAGGNAENYYAVPAGADFAQKVPAQGNIKGGKAFNIAALLKNKLFLICVGAIVLLVALIIVIVNVASSKPAGNPRKGSYMGVPVDGEAVVLYNGSVVKGTDLSANLVDIGESMDGTKHLVKDGSELYLFDNGKVSLVTDELEESNNAGISDSGTVVYISDGSLYVYQGGKSKEIAELDTPVKCDFAISPDGGTVIFAEYDPDEGRYNNVNAWNGKKVIDLDEKFRPHCVSNGGKIVYGVDSNGKFTYVKNLKPGSAEKLKTASHLTPLSADHSKIMFNSNGSYYYFDAGLEDSIKMSSRAFTILIPGGYNTYPENLRSFYAYSSGAIYHYYMSDGSYESEKVTSVGYEVFLSTDGKTILYQDGSDLFKVPVAGSAFKTPPIADDLENNYYAYDSFTCDPSLKHIYYTDEDDNLRYVSSKSKKVGSDVTQFYVNESGVCVFLDTDGDLYYSDRGKDKVKIKGISDDVVNFALRDNIFYAETEYELYVSTDGKNFEKVVEF